MNLGGLSVEAFSTLGYIYEHYGAATGAHDHLHDLLDTAGDDNSVPRRKISLRATVSMDRTLDRRYAPTGTIEPDVQPTEWLRTH